MSRLGELKNDFLFLQELHGELDEMPGVDEECNPVVVRKNGWRDVVAALDDLPVGADGMLISQSQRLSIYEDAGEAVQAAGEITIERLMATSANVSMLANWYSGLLRVPMGEEIHYVHGGFLWLTEFDLVMEIERGTVRRRWMIDNRPGAAARDREFAESERVSSRVQQSILALKPLVDRGDELAFRLALQDPRKSLAQAGLDRVARFVGVKAALRAMRSRVSSDTAWKRCCSKL